MHLLIDFLAAEPSLEYVVKNTFIHFIEPGRAGEVQPGTVEHQPFSDLTYDRDRASLEYVQRFSVDSDKERFDDIPVQPRTTSEGQILDTQDQDVASGPLTPRLTVDNAQKRSPAQDQNGESTLGPQTPRIMASEVQICSAASIAATTSLGGQDWRAKHYYSTGESTHGPLTPRMTCERKQTHPPPASCTSTTAPTGKVPAGAAFSLALPPVSVNDVETEFLPYEVPEQERIGATPPILHGAFGLDNGYLVDRAGGSCFTPSSSMSMGAVGHVSGTCKPCAWFWKPGSCSKGYMCGYCHLCEPGVFETKSGQRKQIKRSKPRAFWTTPHQGAPPGNWQAFQYSDPGSHSSGEPFYGKDAGCYHSN